MKSIFGKIGQELSRLWDWLWSKRSEVAEMDHRDAYMAHVVLEILQTSSSNEFMFVPLYQTIPIHPTHNRENTVEAVNKRAKAISERKQEILKKGRISKELLSELMPSATYIRAIESGDGGYFTFEGNGRVAALKQVFSPHDKIQIELNIFYPKKVKKSQQKIIKLRRMHSMKAE
jgi:hypothetical protein